MDEGKEAGSELIVADGDSAKLLEPEEEPFHKMALLVKLPIDKPRVSLILPGRDTEIRVMVGNKLTKRPFAIGFIRQDGRPFQGHSAEQFVSNRDLVNVTGGQHNLDRIAQSVHDSVNLRASAAAAHSNARIGLRPVLTVSGL